MRDPEDAIDEAYGSWLGSSGYADMKSYRDVFRDGWNAGTEHEARNCPAAGALIDNRLGPNFGKPMICRSCGRPRDANHTDCV